MHTLAHPGENIAGQFVMFSTAVAHRRCALLGEGVQKGVGREKKRKKSRASNSGDWNGGGGIITEYFLLPNEYLHGVEGRTCPPYSLHPPPLWFSQQKNIFVTRRRIVTRTRLKFTKISTESNTLFKHVSYLSWYMSSRCSVYCKHVLIRANNKQSDARWCFQKGH